MSLKAIRIILLFTLLSVAGQVVAFNQHCNMASKASTSLMVMSHGGMQHENNAMSMEHDSVMQTMPCCDMSLGCDMATCVAFMLNSFNNHSEFFNQSSLVDAYKPSFHSFELNSFYKPPILS